MSPRTYTDHFKDWLIKKRTDSPDDAFGFYTPPGSLTKKRINDLQSYVVDDTDTEYFKLFRRRQVDAILPVLVKGRTKTYRILNKKGRNVKTAKGKKTIGKVLINKALSKQFEGFVSTMTRNINYGCDDLDQQVGVFELIAALDIPKKPLPGAFFDTTRETLDGNLYNIDNQLKEGWIQKLNDDVKAVQQQANATDKKVEDLKKQADDTDKEVKDLKTKAKTTDKEVKDLKTKAKTTDKKVKDLRTQADKTDLKLEGVEAAVETIRQQLSRLVPNRPVEEHNDATEGAADDTADTGIVHNFDPEEFEESETVSAKTTPIVDEAEDDEASEDDEALPAPNSIATTTTGFAAQDSDTSDSEDSYYEPLPLVVRQVPSKASRPI